MVSPNGELLVCSPRFPATVFTQKCRFYNFHAVLPKLYPTSRPSLGNPVYYIL